MIQNYYASLTIDFFYNPKLRVETRIKNIAVKVRTKLKMLLIGLKLLMTGFFKEAYLSFFAKTKI